MRKSVSIVVTMMFVVLILLGCGKTCAVDGCENKPLDSKPYCDYHACSVENCQNEKVIGNGKFCKTHTCNDKFCANKAESNNGYCKAHTCTAKDCYNYSNGDYCYYHTCQKEGCDEFKDIRKKYCSVHSSDFNASTQAPNGGTTYNATQAPSEGTPYESETKNSVPIDLSKQEWNVLLMDAKDAVRGKLKYPSEASFPAYSIDDASVTKSYNRELGIATISSTVTAKNTFGETKTTYWLVDFSFADKNRYRVSNVEIYDF